MDLILCFSVWTTSEGYFPHLSTIVFWTFSLEVILSLFPKQLKKKKKGDKSGGVNLHLAELYKDYIIWSCVAM